jgi:uncharacterized membrane protein/thiol-disulfide isomerase/thioredoxin
MRSSKLINTIQRHIVLGLLAFCIFLVVPTLVVNGQSLPKVNMVLFYSPTCGHCHFVITEIFPPLLEQYGDQLNIVGIDVSQPGGQALFLAALKYFNLESGGVPFLVLGDTYLIGSVDIPEKLPGRIEQYLAQGGLDWPSIPGLREAIAHSQNTPSPTLEATIPAQVAQVNTQIATLTSTPGPSPSIGGIVPPEERKVSVWERIGNDLSGNAIAIVVLLGMIISVIGGIIYFTRPSTAGLNNSVNWLIPLFCLVGLGVAIYLSYVEITQIRAICGPVGDCNTVQQSGYARLFGVLPVGILGIVGYVMILLAWVIRRSANLQIASYASLFMLGMSAFGVLFSIYLTFLEPFIIGATCAWCLTSAIIMTILFLLNIASGKLAFQTLYYGEKYAFKRRSSRRAL